MQIEFDVDGQRLIRTSEAYIIEGSEFFVECLFSFSSDWDELEKWAIFKRGTDTYEILIVGNRCIVPVECTAVEGEFTISLIGRQSNMLIIATTSEKLLYVRSTSHSNISYFDKAMAYIKEKAEAAAAVLKSVLEAKDHIDQTDYKIYVGETAPTEDITNAMVWINPAEDDNGSDELAEAVTAAQSAATHAEVQADSIKKYKALWFDNVAAMKAEPSLTAGAYVNTAGYYTPNDGGGASYLIRSKADADVDDGGGLHELANGLVAELIVENGTVCPEQFGAVGDGVTLDIVPFENMFKFIDKHGVPYSNSDKVTYRILGTKFYNVNGLSVPNLFYHCLEFYGGGYIGDITFPSNTFYSLFFNKVQFSDNDTKLTLSPNATIEYKNIHFVDCNFAYQKVAVKYIGRSQNIHFTNCNFKECDVAFDGNNVDMLTFSNCWFDTKKNKIERFTIRLSDDKEGQCNFENCIIVNATADMGDNLFTTFLQTKTRASFSRCRISNELNTTFTAVTYTDDTKDKTDTGHITSCTFDQCDINLNNGIVYLEGLPSIVSINSCSGLAGGNKIINIDKSITDAYSIRPYMKIFVKSCCFDALFMGEIYGQDSNVDGVSMPDIYLPTIPHILKYALQRGYQAQTQHKIVPLLIDYKYDVAANTSIDLFSVKFTNNYSSYHHFAPTIWVRYIAQTPNVSESVPTLDLITFTKTDGQLQLNKITLYGSTNAVYTADQLGINKVSTISMSSTKIIHGIDYGVLSGGLNSIGQM